MRKLEFANTQVELVNRTLNVTRVGCKFSQVRSIERQHYRGRAARVVIGGKLGHASSTDARGVSDEQLTRRAIEAAQVSVPLGLTFPGETASAVQTRSVPPQTSDEELRAIAADMLRGIGHDRPDIMIELEVRRMQETIQLRNTSGNEYELARGWLEGEAWVERHSGRDVLVLLDQFASAQAEGSQDEFARRMARRMRWARKQVEPAPGMQSVILSPSAFASLLRPILFRLNGAQAFQRGSRGRKRQTGAAGQIGQQLFDPRFSLHDDATLSDRPRSAPIDHEGTPGQRITLIGQGVLNGFYHDLYSAALAETRSTGHGWRLMLEPPRPTLTNVLIDRGETSLSDMLKSLDSGLLIDMVMASDGSTGLRGDFARTVVMAYQVKRGRVTGFVKGIGVAGNLYQSLQRIEGLSCDGYWAGDVFAPYIQLGGVTVTV
ncbi:MAG TPA: metallopeptidase TldD-related protein [Anaerolineae bacterium]|nr:metallopeptidase TldD-related protein [Anaerolineae bacterium]